ncbi:hypothetical protein DUNSADRAFT_5509 [Dunaliella salina]|uniref:Encoded protein n=1 Tax=Dunaliella salina TaxID=3046 RepID=A0ABQ7H7B7_DUNSA|nr:hypothetical protein DUNSADRAFT_5509 [Dunaliella salina]|eukprot:KAF5842742.1 hypothetical protein DUNSADRAFT_5509 [Dunaliella salina]
MDPYPTASNLLPIDPYGGLGYTDGRHLRALSPTRFSDYENIPVTSPRRGYLEHLAHIEAETQRLRRELRGY